MNLDFQREKRAAPSVAAGKIAYEDLPAWVRSHMAWQKESAMSCAMTALPAVRGNGPCRKDASAWAQEKGFGNSKPCECGMMLCGGGRLRQLHARLAGGVHANTRLLEKNGNRKHIVSGKRWQVKYTRRQPQQPAEAVARLRTPRRSGFRWIRKDTSCPRGYNNLPIR